MASTLVLSEVGDEIWGAVLEDGRVVEIHVENSRLPGTAGNVYKGRVSRILPGMQSAFIDIGAEKDAFLHVSDLPSAPSFELDFEADEGEEPAEGGDSQDGAASDARPRARARSAPLPPIEDLLREGQEIVVQISKEPIAQKGPRVTAHVALPGRVLVYLPRLDRVFVSRRIEDPDERDRLARLAAVSRATFGGWIVRTAAEGAADEVLARDAAYLADLWAAIRERETRSGAPVLLHRDLNLAERLLRDVVSEEFQEVVVDSDRLRETATGFLKSYLAHPRVRVRLAEGSALLLDQFGIHQEIQRALSPRIWLRSGGSIVVNPTEALVAIDVNTGKYVGKRGLEETAFRTNLEAVREIVRLLRLRDLGGIIVIDFIDMTEGKHREALSAALDEELRKDRSRTKLLAMSDFGLVQLTRKRTRRSLDRALQTACPECGGSGRIRSALALYYEIQRDLARGAPLAGQDVPVVRLHPSAIARLEAEGLRLRLPAPPRADGVVPRAEPGVPEVDAATLDASAPPASPRLVPDPSLSEESYDVQW